MVAGANSRACSRNWPADLRRARNQGYERHHGCLASQDEKGVGALRGVEGDADSASVPAHVRARTATTARCDGPRRGRTAGQYEQMVRKHYAAWIPERQERLTAV